MPRTIDEQILQFIENKDPKLKKLLLDSAQGMTAEDIYVVNGLLAILTQVAKDSDELFGCQRALFFRTSHLRGKTEAIEEALSEKEIVVEKTDIDNTDWA